MELMEEYKVKEGFRKTEIGIIPTDWEIRFLGDISEISSGGTPNRQTPSFWNGSIPWITTTQIDFNLISTCNELITEDGLKNSAAKVFKPGTLLMAMYGQGKTRGKIGLLNISAATNQACAAIKLNNSVSISYIFFNLSSRYEEIRNLSNTGNQENLNSKLIKQIQIPLPPTLQEQRAIATALSDVDALIRSLGELIDKKRAVKQGAMQELLTGKRRLAGFEGEKRYKKTEAGIIPDDWKSTTVGTQIEFSGGSQPPRDTFLFSPKEGYVRLLQIRDYKTDKYKTYIPIELAQKKCNTDDVMIGRYGPPIFQILRGLEGAYNVALIKAIPKSTIDKEFMYYFLTQEKLFKFVENLSQRSSGQTGVDLVQLKNYSFPIPSSLEEQLAIAQALSDMDAEITALEAKQAKYQQIKQGMMQELLTGKTRLV